MRHADCRWNARRPRVDRRQLCAGFEALAEGVANDGAKIALRFPTASAAPRTDHAGFEFGQGTTASSNPSTASSEATA
jgi:hypothetical protein